MSKKVNTQPYKGARDFYPEDKAFQKWMFATWRDVVESFGYVEYDAPILEPTDIYLLKGSEEIVKDQTYTFNDRGDRSVTIRTEMTPTVSRMIAGKRQELAYPARWYSIPNLWRYERMQRGRGREFFQLNVDVFGVPGVQAEVEMVQIVDGIFRAFKAKRTSYSIQLNSRVLVNEVLEQAGVTGDDKQSIIRLIDRKEKMPAKEFKDELRKLAGTGSKLISEFLEAKSLKDLSSELSSLDSVADLNHVLQTAKSFGISNIEFSPSLMRGFDYYTDIVFEVFDTDPDNNRSMFGGGRYDGLVGLFGTEPIPTVGFGMGDMTFQNFLESHKLIPNIAQSVDATVIIRDDEAVIAAMKLADELREDGANIAVDYSMKKIDKQLKSAVKSGVEYVIFVGSEDVKAEKYVLKNLKNGKEQTHSLDRIKRVVSGE